jgi:hypothetical protein
MSTHTDFGADAPSAPPRQRTPAEGAGRAATAPPKLETIEVVAEGRVAVTRIGMPRVFRLLLALTGVRI